MTAYRIAWSAITLTLVAIGTVSAVAGLRGAVLALTLAGTILGCWFLCASGRIQRPEPDGPDKVSLAYAGGVGALSVVSAAGLMWLLGPSALALCVLIGAVAPPLIDRIASTGPAAAEPGVSALDTLLALHPDPAEPHAQRGAGERQTALDDPAIMSDAELQTAWRRSFVHLELATDPSERARLALLRATYLDELERRDPTGFSRWLDQGARAASDPGRYVRTRSDEPRGPEDR